MFGPKLDWSKESLTTIWIDRKKVDQEIFMIRRMILSKDTNILQHVHIYKYYISGSALLMPDMSFKVDDEHKFRTNYP